MYTNVKLSDGLFHELPTDLTQALVKNDATVKAWEGISPIARNEWICWCITVKQEKTRQEHIARTVTELAGGKKRPCCWVGCIHRTDKPVSAWAKKVLIDKQPLATKRP